MCYARSVYQLSIWFRSDVQMYRVSLSRDFSLRLLLRFVRYRLLDILNYLSQYIILVCLCDIIEAKLCSSYNCVSSVFYHLHHIDYVRLQLSFFLNFILCVVSYDNRTKFHCIIVRMVDDLPFQLPKALARSKRKIKQLVLLWSNTMRVVCCASLVPFESSSRFCGTRCFYTLYCQIDLLVHIIDLKMA